MGDADVFEVDVEFGSAFEEVSANAIRDGLTLGDEFGGVELGDDGFEDFVADGWEDALVVVLAEILFSDMLAMIDFEITESIWMDDT